MNRPIISENAPLLILFLLDQSGSMAEKIEYQGRLMPLSQVVTSIINSVISELVLRCRRGTIYRDYFKVGVMGYSQSSLYSLLDYISEYKSFFSVNELARVETPVSYDYLEREDSHENLTTFKFRKESWIDDYSMGATPTYMALGDVFKMLKDYCGQNSNCIPPILIHITDGDATDSTPQMLLELAEKIKKLSTQSGNVIFLNVHLSSFGNGVIFPICKDQ